MTTSLPTTRLGWTGMHLTRTGFAAIQATGAGTGPASPVQ